jgi:hypothetical protein
MEKSVRAKATDGLIVSSLAAKRSVPLFYYITPIRKLEWLMVYQMRIE